MVVDFTRLNAGSDAPPRLRIQHSLWSLRRLPMNAEVEWTRDEKFSRVEELDSRRWNAG